MNLDFDSQKLLQFYIGQLKSSILPFWLERGIDYEYGGYFTCFDNEGRLMASTDKYTWSQGRMIWLFSELSRMSCFPSDERLKFLEIAKSGAVFLMSHCLLENGNCTFIMDRAGNPKSMVPDGDYDISIYADSFAILGISRYVAVSGSKEAYTFALKLFKSFIERIEAGVHKAYPYPVPEGYEAHGLYMTVLITAEEMAYAAKKNNYPELASFNEIADRYMYKIMDSFVSKNFVLHEFLRPSRGDAPLNLLERYINPGHTIEDMWFVIHQAVKNKDDSIIDKAFRVLEKTVETGWDKEFGGLQLFADQEGGQPQGAIAGIENEMMVSKIINDWGNKLWWPHSEALYSTILAVYLTGDTKFMQLYKKIHEYTFKVFPNPDDSIGEWIQIRDRRGNPEIKVVALPVKDPFHIVRNFILIIELLQGINEGKDISEILG